MKMDESSRAKYVQLSKRIFVPNEWPVRGLRTFLLKLTTLVINDVNCNGVIVLQVQDIPTVLVRREENDKVWYFFEKIARPLPAEAYIIDVVVGRIDSLSETNSVVSDDLSERSVDDGNDEGISLDNYNVVMHQSENRTAYYFVIIQENVQPLSSERETDGRTQRFLARNAKR
ncbi:conserved hypothetical protein [Bracoviriform facetosae]|uniref:Uncharacterized protein n=1 Tax=Bracoviriform facetosae TaxID=2083300 RepID=B8PQ79_9VIRU|nr:conserved hypothetical protein [Bracoviriform facetosae]ACE75505.1 conserved hypothetical protein [Bracoviriform facetosae]